MKIIIIVYSCSGRIYITEEMNEGISIEGKSPFTWDYGIFS